MKSERSPSISSVLATNAQTEARRSFSCASSNTDALAAAGLQRAAGVQGFGDSKEEIEAWMGPDEEQDATFTGGGSGPVLGPDAAARRRIPAGHILQMDTNPDGVLRAYEGLWAACMDAPGLHVKKDDPEYTFRGSPVEDVINQAFSGAAFYSSSVWQGDTVDDGYNDLANVGLWDCDVTPSAVAYMQNLRAVSHGGETATFSTGAAGAGSSAQTSTAGGQVGGGYSGVSGQISGSHASTKTATDTGSVGVSSVNPAITCVGDLVFVLSLKMDELSPVKSVGPGDPLRPA